MAYNKVTYGGKTLIDLTADTVTAATLLKGYKAHDKAGKSVTGTYEASSSVENILEDGFASGDVTYVESENVITATNATTGQVLTKTFGDNAVATVLTSGSTVIGKLVRSYNNEGSQIVSQNSYTGLTTTKTFDFENHTVTIVVKNASSGSVVRSVTKKFQ